MALDPTHSGKTRSMFRGEAQQRLRRVAVLVRTMLGEQDLLGLRGNGAINSHLSGDARVSLFNDWFNGTLYNQLVGWGWVQPHLERAFRQGMQRAMRELSLTAVAQERLEEPVKVNMQLVQHELEGIADACLQRATRTVAQTLVRRSIISPMVLVRMVTEQISKIADARIMTMCNTYTVTMHNQGKLAVYRAAGVQKVGIDVEHITTPRITSDAAPKRRRKLRRRLGLVNVLTAGDDLVCQICEDIAEDGPYTLDDAAGLIPAHARCRCAFVPAEDMRFSPITGE